MPNSNHVEFPDSLVDFSPSSPTGYEPEMAKRDTVDALAGLGTREFPSSWWIDPNEWREYAAMNDRHSSWAEDYRNRFTHQGRTTSCTCQCLVQCMEIARNKQRMSKDDAVWLSPLSVYSEADPTGRRGSYLQRVLGIALRRGLLPDVNGPDGHGSQKNKFKHTMHQDSSAGPWVHYPSGFPSGWEDTAKWFKPLEVINISSFEEYVCCVLQGFPVATGRRGHSLPAVKIVWRDHRIYAMMSDSYNRHVYDSERLMRESVGGAYVICTVVTPDDWSKPAG